MATNPISQYTVHTATKPYFENSYFAQDLWAGRDISAGISYTAMPYMMGHTCRWQHDYSMRPQ